MLSRFFWLFLPQLSYAFFLWALLVVTLRVLGAGAAGDLALAFAVTAPLFLLGGLQLKSILVVDAERKRPVAAYARLYSLGGTVAFLMALALATVFYPNRALLILLIALFRFAEGGAELYHSLFLRAAEVPAMGVSLFLRAFCGALTFCFFLFTSESLPLAAFSLLVVSLLTTLLFDHRRIGALEASHRSFHETSLKALFWLALPLGVTVLFSSATTNVPRYVLEFQFGARELGVFAALFALANALSRIPTAAATLLRPRLAEDVLKGKEFFLNRSYRLFFFTLAFWAVVIGISSKWGEHFLVLFYGPELEPYNHPFVLILVAHLFLSLSGIGNTMLQARQIFHLQPFLYGTNLFLSVFLSTLLIPRGGLLGASWVVFGYGLGSLALYFFAFLWLSRGGEGRSASQ